MKKIISFLVGVIFLFSAAGVYAIPKDKSKNELKEFRQEIREEIKQDWEKITSVWGKIKSFWSIFYLKETE